MLNTELEAATTNIKEMYKFREKGYLYRRLWVLEILEKDSRFYETSGIDKETRIKEIDAIKEILE